MAKRKSDPADSDHAYAVKVVCKQRQVTPDEAEQFLKSIPAKAKAQLVMAGRLGLLPIVHQILGGNVDVKIPAGLDAVPVPAEAATDVGDAEEVETDPAV